MGMESNFAIAITFANLFIAQPPQPGTTPGLLPSSITGVKADPVVPVSNSTSAIPSDRFKQIGSYPAETAQCVFGIRTGSDWLAKIHQPSGRVLAGVNPSLAAVWPHSTDARQAMALWGMACSSRFMGDANLTAKTNQFLLTMLGTIKADVNDPKRFVPQGSENDRAIIAACFILAIAELPQADDRSAAIAEHMAVSLMTNPGTTPLSKALTLRGLTISQKMKPADWKKQTLVKLLDEYGKECKTKTNPILAAGVIHAACECGDTKYNTIITTLTDATITSQYDRTTVRHGFLWAGAFPVEGDSEPNFEQAMIAMGLIAATKHAMQAGDVAGYARCRQSLNQSLMFVRGLQATPESASHFEPGFRMRSVVGGVRSSVNDGILRADATGLCLAAFSAFTSSGLEARE